MHVPSQGLVRNIGVANLTCAGMRDLLAASTIPPAVLQVELHPYLQQSKLLRFCREHGIAVTGFSPLGSNSYVELSMATSGDSVLAEPTVTRIAAKHGKTPAQIVLRWAVQRGTSIIPKSSKPDRLRENVSLASPPSQLRLPPLLKAFLTQHLLLAMCPRHHLSLATSSTRHCPYAHGVCPPAARPLRLLSQLR